ncbi:MAG: hypothetical protein GC134_09320 [Proteobacteria bacterium]|nr:hypothetical protein [Pseudomonadota bacterium]
MTAPSLDTAYVDLLLGWDRLEKSLGADAVIDFNLLDADGGTDFASRWDVLLAVKALRRRAEREANPLAYRRLGAHEAFLRNRMGEHWDFEPYIAATQGFRFALYGDDVLDAARQSLTARLAPWQLALDKDTEKNLETRDTEIAEKDVADFYTDFLTRHKPQLEALIGSKADFTVDISFGEVDQYWAAWVDGRGNAFRLRFNRRHMKQHWRARSIQLALHELFAHLVQMSILRSRIAAGELPAWLGLTTVHGPEQFQSEGLAQTLPLFWQIPEAQEPLVQTRCALSHFSGLVWHNAHIRLHGGTPLELVVDEVRRWLPWREEGKVAHSLNSLGNHPLYRSYEFVYGASQDFFTRLAVEKGQAVLPALYTNWLTYDDLLKLRA